MIFNTIFLKKNQTSIDINFKLIKNIVNIIFALVITYWSVLNVLFISNI